MSSHTSTHLSEATIACLVNVAQICNPDGFFDKDMVGEEHRRNIRYLKLASYVKQLKGHTFEYALTREGMSFIKRRGLVS